jgi:transposase
MWQIDKRARVYLALGVTDMRKGLHGLAALVESELEGQLFSGDLFVFSNRQRNFVKILYFHRNGLCCWMKKLAKHRFHWPNSDEELREIRKHELAWLLDGLDISQAHEKLHFEAAT